MQAVFLAAGHGKRLRPYTESVPKQLLEINERPILEYNFRHLPEAIDEVILVVGWLGEQIRQRFGGEFLGRPIKYIEQTERLGTFHALSLCRDILNEKFIVMMGDDLYDRSDIEKCLKHDLCILVRDVDNPWNFGVMETNEDGTLKEIAEKPENPKSNLINAGLYVLDKKIFDYEPEKIKSGEYGLPQTIAKMAKDRKIHLEKATFWMPINTEEDLEKAREYFRK